MKLKNVNLTFFILAILLVSSLGFFAVARENSSSEKNIFIDSDQDGLSDEEEKVYGTDPKNPDTDGDGYSDGTEISSGYDPLKKAPADRLTPEEKLKIIPKNESIPASADGKNNFTEKVSREILTLAANSEGKDITMEKIQEIINPLIESEESDIPEISRSEINIKKQNYGKLSTKEIQEKKKKDVADYSVAVMYVLASNSPEPLTSSNDISSVMNKMIGKLSSALESGDSSGLENLSQSGEKTLEQLKKIEVPEEMVKIQIKALQYAIYAKNLKDLIERNPEDPMSNLLNYSKIQAFIESFIGFFEEMQKKFDEYAIEPEYIENKMGNYGIKFLAD